MQAQIVLLAGARRLDDLVVGTTALVDETIAEGDGGVVDDLGFLVGEQLLVATVFRNEAAGHGMVLAS